MRSIVLHIHDDDCFEARFQAALDLSKAFGSHIDCVQPIPIDVSVDIYGMGGAEMAPILRDNADIFQQRVEARLASEAAIWTWTQEFDSSDHMLVAHSALADLVVLGTSDPMVGSAVSSIAGQVAIHAQTPVLAVPGAVRSFDVSAPAVVAWNGSVQSSHALRAAVPLLRRAASVQIVAVEENRATRAYELSATAGAEFLSRHGVDCEIVAIPNRSRPSDALRQAAEMRRAGHIVMGAYGHTRLRETVFGGVTRELLAHSSVPLFLCH
ncbi:MAG: universal stress protein [Candidatus Andeanibacterium colombiense]|uniref:Universal stress protein n=1 Tax=Candidatus Andeanibacterium colombiense TaxID=3121345 RepID=A0AAJ6BNX7_9SPHN|nr:MAG: universal stress protein [Sphingomonadaceae bacterium]